MNEIATVVERLPGGRVRVEIRRGAACDACHAKGACAPLSGGASVVRFEADDPFDCAPGTSVHVAIAEGAVLKAVWWVYVVPLALAIGAGVGVRYGLAGGAAGQGTADLLAAAAFLAGAGIGFAVLRGVELRARRAAGSSYRVRVVGVAGDVSASPPSCG
ncbi:MAG TPA: SoxR reducing system RseC family protein [Myxococcota bacterium]|nr:SoxR reducing system RseC family protein [Myxococcota bacterium]